VSVRVAGRESAVLRTAVRASLSTLADDIARFLLVGVAWVVAVGAVLSVSQRHPVALLGASGLVPLAGGTTRMALRAVHGAAPTFADFVEGLTHRARWAWPLAVAAGAVFAIGAANIALAARGAGLIVTVSALVSVQVMLAAAMWLSATWPLLFDPNRDDEPTTAVLRRGATAVARWPWRFVGVVALETLLMLAQLTVLALAFVLPSVMMLVAGYVVVPRGSAVAVGPGGDD
jgi:hypothetical protein